MCRAELDSCARNQASLDVARIAVLAFARARDATLASWIEEHVSFPNSMVDRIAPSVGAGQRARANTQSGVEDDTRHRRILYPMGYGTRVHRRPSRP
jgi:mannitol-1-phosphate/altronate dehydrogenase